MSLTTHSAFYYGFAVTSANNKINFNEGAAELTAAIAVGEYSMTGYATAAAAALNVAGALTFTVTFSRVTRIMTIAAGSNFTLLISSGANAGSSAFATLGFSGADVTGAATYAGGTAVGTSYNTQFILQDHIASANFVRATDATVNTSASGRVEVFKFGDSRFVQANIKYATNTTTTAGPVRNSATGVAKLQSFMDYLITKGPVEYMADESSVGTFQTLILESTPDDSKGTGYTLKELYGQGLPGYFETGTMKFRVLS